MVSKALIICGLMRVSSHLAGCPSGWDSEIKGPNFKTPAANRPAQKCLVCPQTHMPCTLSYGKHGRTHGCAGTQTGCRLAPRAVPLQAWRSWAQSAGIAEECKQACLVVMGTCREPHTRLCLASKADCAHPSWRMQAGSSGRQVGR